MLRQPLTSIGIRYNWSTTLLCYITKIQYFRFLALIFYLASFQVYAETWNDISRINPETVSEIIDVHSQQDVINTLKQLPENTKITISGTQHSQGGHIIYPNGVVLNMKNFNKVVSVSPKDKLIIVQSGATWAAVQKEANQYGLAVKVMQSSNIFSIGGSLSANVHGRDPRFGPIIETVRSMKVALANGDVVTASRSVNSDLFFSAIGGYGLLGVILEVEIELTENLPLEKETLASSVDAYAEALQHNADKLSLHYGRCSFVPGKSFLTECYSTNFIASAAGHAISDLKPEKNIVRNTFIFGVSRKSNLGKAIRWKLQKKLLDTPGQKTVIDRNPAMQPAVHFLTYNAPEDTDILQEYFVPVEHFPHFFKELKQTLEKHEVNLLSITLRYLKENQESYLSYAIDDMIAVVLYINIELTDQAIQTAKNWTRKLVDLSLKNKGTYYLTYQRFPTLEQFEIAYPKWKKFMAVKCKYDPNEVFFNKFYEQYLRAAYNRHMQSGKTTISLGCY